MLEPLALSVPLKLSVVPISTLPNDNDVGESANCPTLDPFPESEMLSVGSEAFEATVSMPLLLPLTVGANVTGSAVLCPAAIATGTPKLPRLNPLPLTTAWEMETLEPPEFVRVTDNVWLLPTRVLPKFRAVAVGEM